MTGGGQGSVHEDNSYDNLAKAKNLKTIRGWIGRPILIYSRWIYERNEGYKWIQEWYISVYYLYVVYLDWPCGNC